MSEYAAQTRLNKKGNVKEFRLQGLGCTDCAAKFEKNVQKIDHVEAARLNYGAAKITVTGEITPEQINQAGAFDNIKVDDSVRGEPHNKTPFLKKRQNQSMVASLFFIVLGYTLYFTIGATSTLTIGMFAIAVLVGGYDMFKVGFQNLAKFVFDMKTLMTIAVLGAVIIGEWAEGAAVVFLFALSEVLEEYSVDKARQSIHSLMEIAPNTAFIREGGKIVEKSVEDVAISDVMLIKPGEKIAMDGEVIKGQTSINQAAITGESLPVHKTRGDEVFAGTLNEEGAIEVKVTKHVEDTTIAKIIHLVEEAQAEKAPAQQFVDKFAKYYTPAIIVLAIMVAIFPPLLAGTAWSKWVYLGLATLVVGCPCALVISTPVAIVTAIGNAARNGVLIKGGIHLEEAGHLKAIAFDKTGTLTEGTPEVSAIKPMGDHTEDDVLQLAMAVENFSQHPLASAIIRRGKQKHISPIEAENFDSITGKGAQADINGETYYIGNTALFKDLYGEDVQDKEMTHLQAEGHTVMFLGTKDMLIGSIAVADQVREKSASVIDYLKHLGIKETFMLTGDNQATGQAIGKKLGIHHVEAELLPEQKLERIHDIKEKYGKVAMVGDGINDAPALATADLGIAMGGGGTDAALETADIALMADNLEKLSYTIGLSRKATRIIKENITFAFLLKVIALLLVIPGLLTLWLAIIADVGATLLVVLNSMRLMRNK